MGIYQAIHKSTCYNYVCNALQTANAPTCMHVGAIDTKVTNLHISNITCYLNAKQRGLLKRARPSKVESKVL